MHPGDDVVKEPAPARGAPRTHVLLAGELRRRMQLRLILPGDALPPERELMRTYSAGRGTVQQALALLAREGLVIKRRGRTGGAFVTDVLERHEHLQLALERVRDDRAAIEEALAYRLQLEPNIVAEACRARSADDLAAIRDVQRQLTAAETETQFMHFDNEFHLAVAAATHNRYFQRAAEEIRSALGDALWVAGGRHVWLGRTVAEHDGILAAIEHANPDAGLLAARAHAEHTAKTVGELLGSL